ncbi:MAG: SMP-30/gluconolactonase/LRE family protein [Bacteroidota bacterium]|nr:SMP-30/gluconolactonase/LRE family protein [Bacteroidota bacterium]
MKKLFLIITSAALTFGQSDFIKVNDSEFWNVVPKNIIVERIASGFQFTEGPIWSKEGFLLFSDIPANIIYKIDKEGKTTPFIQPSQNSNGLVFDKQGNLIICEHSGRKVVKRNLQTGVNLTIADNFNGKKFNSPNDVVVHSNGTVYFTDPPYGLMDKNNMAAKELGFSGVFMVKNGTVFLIDTTLQRPNGIALSPDLKKLYVAQSEFDWLWNAYDLDANGKVIGKSLFYKGPEITGNPDGVKTDMNGNVFCTGNNGIVIFSKSGKLLGTIILPENTSNLCWGDTNYSSLYVTAQKSVYRLKLNTKGFITY